MVPNKDLLQTRMVKLFEAPETIGRAMMDRLYEEPQVGASAGVRNGARKPRVAVAKRVPVHGEFQNWREIRGLRILVRLPGCATSWSSCFT